MRVTTRFLAAFAAVAVLGYTSVSSAVTMTTGAALSPSNLALDFAANGEDEFGNPTQLIIGQSGDLAVAGSADVTVNLDGLGNGTLAFNSSSFAIADTSFIVDLGPIFGAPLGNPATQLTVTLSGVALGITSTDIPVVGGVWNLDGIGAPSAFEINLNQGLLLLEGDLLGGLGQPNPTVVDLSAAPVSVSLADLLGFGLGGSASAIAVSTDIPLVAVDIGESLLEVPDLLFLNLSGEINVAVPEPTTYAMLGMGIVGLMAAGRRRFRKA